MPKQIVLSKQDYQFISNLINSEGGFSEFCTKELEKELRFAKILSSVDLPKDVVRINSTVRILEMEGRWPFTIQLVKPSQADVSQHKISIQAPLGAALVGYRKGDTVAWKMPGGIKHFRILEVIND